MLEIVSEFKPVTLDQASILDELRSKGACASPEVDPNLFYPADRERSDMRDARVNKAKEVCGRCAVRKTCLFYAIAYGEENGIWGGETELERKRRKRRMI